MGRVAQASLAAVGLLTPAPVRGRERRLQPRPRVACHDRSSAEAGAVLHREVIDGRAALTARRVHAAVSRLRRGVA